MGDESSLVSVVIPSTGRQELTRAVLSARCQDYPGGVEVIVVFDLDEAATPPHVVERASAADHVIFSGGGRKGGTARNLGVAQARGRWIAFLDDDDAWMPNKLSVQLDIANREVARGKSPVVGCRVAQVVEAYQQPHVTQGIPARLISSAEAIEKYLFVNRRPGAKRASFFTSTVLAERWLCETVVWDEALARHQDWDWLIRASKVPSVSFRQAEDDLAYIYVGSPGSISAGAAWDTSLEWAQRELLPLGSRVYVDFLLAQTVRYALQKRDMAGVWAVAKKVISSRTFPGVGPILIAVAGTLPRKTLQNLMRRIQ